MVYLFLNDIHEEKGSNFKIIKNMFIISCD